MTKTIFSLTEIGFVTSTTLAVLGVSVGIGISPINIIILCLLVSILAIQIIWFVRWNKDSQNLFKKDFTKNRDRALDLIANTKIHLHTTHFAKTAPPSVYTEKVIEKLQSGVDVYRVVGKNNLSEDGVGEWLNKFKGFTKNYHETITSKDLPFDISVFDGKKTILYFPSFPNAEDFDLTLYIENEELSNIFMMLFSKINNSAVEYSPMNMPKGSGVWLKDAYHVPYLVMEGVIEINEKVDILSLLKGKYREIDLNNIGNSYAMDNNNKAIFCIEHNRCSLCYFINGEATDGANYMDILTNIRGGLDSMVLNIEEYLSEHDSKVEFSRIYLQDPSKGAG